MGKRLALVVVAVVAIVGGWWAASPAWTVARMNAAAKAGDASAFEAYVDKDALRADIRSDLAEHAASALAAEPMPALGAAVYASMSELLVARVASTEMMMEVFSEPERFSIVDRGPSSFWLADRTTSRRVLRFDRSGLRWKLSATALDKMPR